MRRIFLRLLVIIAGVVASLGAPALDFKLLDVNPGSPRFNTLVSPRNYQLQVSAYYFGHAD